MIYIQLRSTGLLPFAETVEHLDPTTTLDSLGLHVDSSHKSRWFIHFYHCSSSLVRSSHKSSLNNLLLPNANSPQSLGQVATVRLCIAGPLTRRSTRLNAHSPPPFVRPPSITTSSLDVVVPTTSPSSSVSASTAGSSEDSSNADQRGHGLSLMHVMVWLCGLDLLWSSL